MSSTTKKKRLKSAHRNPNPNSSWGVFGFLKEPSPDLFPSKHEFIQLLGVIAMAALVAIACNHLANVFNAQPKPFCDSGAGSYEDDLLPEFCEPCPMNGECSEGNLECIHGYKKLGRSCVEDGEINQTAKKLSELVELRVCEAYVRFMCDSIGTNWVQAPEIWKEVDEHVLKEKLNNESYAYSKQKAMETIESSLEMQTDFQGIREFKCPDWLAEHYKPLSCQLRLWVYDHALMLVPVSMLLVGVITILIFSFRRIRQRQYLSTRSEQLYQQVCEILEENAMEPNNLNGKGQPWVVASRLRDHLLLPRERRDPFLWKKVEELVQEDSRVDQYPKLVKGESKVVWEWQVEGSLSSSRKKAKEAERKLEISGETQESSVLQQRTSHSARVLNF